MNLLAVNEWDDFLAAHPDAHLLQTSQWGQLKSEFGWKAARLAHRNAGVQVLFRRLPLGFSFAYIPKGPVGEDLAALLPGLDALCKKQRAIALKLEPDRWEMPGEAEPPAGFRRSRHSVQPPRTILVDLQAGDEVLLNRMKQKTRYNIRLGQRKGVVVRESGDLESFNRLMQTTAARDEFGVHDEAYYRRVYELFKPHELCSLLVAEAEGQPLAALMVFARGGRSWYLYGASSNEHRNLMPTYVLQWEAMRWARARGCTVYDLWGVPDEDETGLEDAFSTREDGLWGVYRFKRGFGGQVQRAAGPFDRVFNPLLYRLYEHRMASA